MNESSTFEPITRGKLEESQSGGIFVEFVIGLILCILMALLIVLGNSLFLYLAYRKKNFGILRDLDIDIKSLAVTEHLVGLVGIPCRVLALWLQGSFDISDGYNEGNNFT